MYFNADFSEDDISVLKYQLQRDNIFIESVLQRCPWGFPQVVLLSPVVSNEKKSQAKLNFIAFSTPLWLTCPFLNDKIHALEDKGCIKKMEALIQGNEDFLEAMKKAHVHYALLRKKLYLQFIGDLDHVEPNHKLMSSGVGGIRMYETIKCLHLHYAHYSIYPENCVGKITAEILGEETHCRGGTCRNAIIKE